MAGRRVVCKRCKLEVELVDITECPKCGSNNHPSEEEVSKATIVKTVKKKP